jgi:hypothetical protein
MFLQPAGKLLQTRTQRCFRPVTQKGGGLLDIGTGLRDIPRLLRKVPEPGFNPKNLFQAIY